MSKRVLVVDDEPDILKVVTFRLKKEGYEVITAVDGQEGLDFAKSKKPDLILLDLRLPKMNGDEVCKLIKADEQIKHIPVIFITASQQSDVGEMAKEFCAQDYIVKPFTPEELFAKVRQYLK
ncbi:response regulator [Candidatus Margulisiibacteriota bacterium]